MHRTSNGSRRLSVASALVSVLGRVFRTYRSEANRELSDHRKRMLAIDEKRAFDLQQRDLAAEKRKNKTRQGVLRLRDHGSVQEKLRKAIGGKSMRRILKRERRLARETPDALVVEGRMGFSAPVKPLQRGVDFALIAGHRRGTGLTLVLSDRVQDFKVSYDVSAANELFAFNC